MLSIKLICCTLATTLFTQLLVAQNIARRSTSQKPVVIAPEGGNFIPMKDAARLTKQFQHNYKNTKFPYAEKFNKDLVLRLLNQPGASGLRIYFGENQQQYMAKKPRKSISLVLVAVDDKGIDITTAAHIQDRKLRIRKISYTKANNFYSLEDGLALENGQQCLDMCDLTSRLYQAH